MSSGERPIGAAKGKQSDTQALCQPPPPPVRGRLALRTECCDVPLTTAGHRPPFAAALGHLGLGLRTAPPQPLGHDP